MNARLFLPVLAALAGLAPLRADEARWNVTAECQMVTLPQKTALALLPELNDDKKIEAAFAKIQESIAKGEAQLAANLIVKMHPGDKGKAESTEEIRYATEFDPPQLPPVPLDKQLLEKWPHVGITPTAFETRPVGATLSIEVKVSDDGKTLTVDCEPAHVRLLRTIKVDAGRLANGEHLFIEQPIFHDMKNTCSLFVGNGQRVLLGVHKLTEPANTLELFFLRVSAVKGP